MQKVMSKAALLAFFDPALLLFSSVEGFDKTQTQFFDLAASRADVRPKQCVYVGEKRPNAGSRHRPDFAHPIIRSTSFM
jgi:FMN phosphatase YigB (HAD superfamily)